MNPSVFIYYLLSITQRYVAMSYIELRHVEILCQQTVMLYTNLKNYNANATVTLDI